MHKQLSRLLLLIAIYIAPLTYSSLEAKIAQSTDTTRLQKSQ